jgi:hypothetical protein
LTFALFYAILYTEIRERPKTVKELCIMTRFENITLNGQPLSDPATFWQETRRLLDEAGYRQDSESVLAIITLWDIAEWEAT